MARQKPPAPVFKIDFEDAGQLFTTWYVRNRAVIDCEPCLPRTWVGTRVVRPSVAGEKPHIMTRDKKYITLDCPVVAVTELPQAEAEQVIARWKDLMREELGSEDA